MYYSYVMGIGTSIYDLKEEGFTIESDDKSNYMISFPKEKAGIWEDYISNHLEVNFWNEYLTEDGVVFIFHLEDGLKRYRVTEYENDEVLRLCERLCKQQFESIEGMLRENPFYKDKM